MPKPSKQFNFRNRTLFMITASYHIIEFKDYHVSIAIAMRNKDANKICHAMQFID
uniref:Uncharacterized protein n=1 Tax=Arundo donax TaxID=35708 RepID=A0A0A9E7K0_ARUDO